MPVPSTIEDLSTNPAENYPTGSESVFPSLDDYLRTAFAFIAQLREGPILLTAIPDDFVTLAKLKQAIQHGVAQAGDFKWRATTTAGDGWLICNGAAYSRTDYAALFAAIGTRFGAGNGSTTFNVPDIRGEFIRGADLGRGVDPGRVLGSGQNFLIEKHTHAGTTSEVSDHAHGYDRGTILVPGAGGIEGGSGREYVNQGTETGLAGRHRHSFTTEETGGTETRPRNIALLPCIFTGL